MRNEIRIILLSNIQNFSFLLTLSRINCSNDVHITESSAFFVTTKTKMIGESRLLESWGKCSFVGNEDYFRGNNEFVSLLARAGGNLKDNWNVYIQTPIKMNSKIKFGIKK